MNANEPSLSRWFPSFMSRCLPETADTQPLARDQAPSDGPIKETADISMADVSLAQQALAVLDRATLRLPRSFISKKLFSSARSQKNLELAIGSLEKSKRKTITSGQCASEKTVETHKKSLSLCQRLLGYPSNEITKSALGAITTPAEDDGEEPREFLYFRKEPFFEGGEYRCYLGLDMNTLRQKALAGPLTEDQVKDCLVLVKKARTETLCRAKMQAYAELRTHRSDAIRTLAPNTLLPGSVVSQKKSFFPWWIVTRPVVIQKLHLQGDVEVFTYHLSRSKEPAAKRVQLALILCQRMQALVQRGREHGVIFGDLKSPNMAVTADGDLVVCDLGCFQGHGAMGAGTGTLDKEVNFPPELLGDELFHEVLRRDNELEYYLFAASPSEEERINLFRRNDLYVLGITHLQALAAAFLGQGYFNCTQLHDRYEKGTLSPHEYLKERQESFRSLITQVSTRAAAAKNAGEITADQGSQVVAQLELITKLLQPDLDPDFQLQPLATLSGNTTVETT